MVSGNATASVCYVSWFASERCFLGDARSRSSKCPVVQAWTCTRKYLPREASQEPIVGLCHR